MAGVERETTRVGAALRGTRGRRIGTVDAVFADYLLVRTRGLLPVDLYVPRTEVRAEGDRLSPMRPGRGVRALAPAAEARSARRMSSDRFDPDVLDLSERSPRCGS